MGWRDKFRLTFFTQDKQAVDFVENNEWGSYGLRYAIGVLGVIVGAIGTTGLLGNAFHVVRMYKWAGDVGMALSTSVAFMVTGLSIILIAISEKLWKR